jgi:hypothetical protein
MSFGSGYTTPSREITGEFMGEVYYGVHKEIAEMLAKKHNLNTFVETGTWHGDSAEWAATRFETVITIEVIEEYYLKAVDRLSKYDNVYIFHDDSRLLLPTLIEQVIDEPALFWLDAHWTGHKDYDSNRYGKCAAGEEIAAINESIFEDAIMVDDARLFPSMMRIKPDEIVKLLSNNGAREVTIKDDIFYAEPI